MVIAQASRHPPHEDAVFAKRLNEIGRNLPAWVERYSARPVVEAEARHYLTDVQCQFLQAQARVVLTPAETWLIEQAKAALNARLAAQNFNLFADRANLPFRIDGSPRSVAAPSSTDVPSRQGAQPTRKSTTRKLVAHAIPGLPSDLETNRAIFAKVALKQKRPRRG